MKIVLSGIYYPMAILRYIEKALKQRQDLDIITVGPYTGNKIPWKGGMYVPEKYAVMPDYEIPFQKNIPIQAVEAKIEEDYDVWIQVDADFNLMGRPTRAKKHIYIGTDPHCVNYDYQRTKCDIFFNMQRVYAKEGDVYLPYAYDPDHHCPPVKPVDKVYDVALVGLMYDHRARVIDKLKKRGLNVYFDTGPIFDEAKAIYHKTKVGFNWSSLNDLNARAFELLAFGLPTVMNTVSDMPLFFAPGMDYVSFDGIESAVNNILYLLDNPARMEELSKNALETVEPHTWGKRVEQLLSYL